MYHDIAKEVLDSWFTEVQQELAKDPNDWDSIRRLILIKNEYQRRGWTIPA